MNYNHYLNKSSKFNNKNRYRLDSKKKNRHTFLITSFVSIAILTGLFTLFIDNEESVETTSKNFTALSSAIISTPSKEQSIALDLPEIASHSEAISRSVTYVEKNVDQKTVSKISAPLSIEQTQTEQSEFKLAEESLSLSKILDEKPVRADNEIKITIKEDVTIEETALPIANKSSAIDKSVVINNNPTPPIKKEKSAETINQQNLTTLTRSKTVIVKSGDTLSAIFKRLSLSSGTLYQIINSSKQAKQLTHIKPGQKLLFTFNDKNKFASLHYDIDRVDTLIISKKSNPDKFTVRVESKEIDVKQQFAAGIITNSLFSSGNKAGLSSAMIMKLAQLFGWDIDFALDIRKGDSFAVLFEEKYIDGKKISNGNILSAEFINRGKTYKAIRYTDASGHTDYYSEKGLSMRKAFLRTPVEFSRISSRFSSGRKHPVLNRIRAHKGVDYAASRGTAIRSVGKGKVIFKGTKGGYGRVIILQHGSKYTTLYAHMKSYNRKIKRGSRVVQGQIIGYVGSSGLATGPHLHYEFRINGVHRNPLTVPLPSASPIAKKYRTDFNNTADTMISQLKSRKQGAIALSEQ